MNFRTFGEKVYFHIPKEKRQKWDVIAEKGIFVSYDENTKSFRIWLPERGQAKIRRNVRFINQHYEFNSNEECELNTIIIIEQYEPESYDDAITCNNAIKWKETMDEIDSLRKTQT